MEPLFFCITERPDPELFDAGWVEIVGGRLVLDRSVWRSDDVSRSPDGCVALRADRDYGTWELKNMAQGRVVILHDGTRRYDVLTGMSTTLWPGTWKGTLTDAFTFVVTSVRPQAPVRRYGAPASAASAVETAPQPLDLPTARRSSVTRALTYLDRHRVKRLALAFLWRQHLAHTPDLAEDLPSAEVGKAFGVPGSTVTGWREELAEYVYLQRGHQLLVRDLVLKHGLMTRADVAEADRYVAELRRGA